MIALTSFNTVLFPEPLAPIKTDCLTTPNGQRDVT